MVCYRIRRRNLSDSSSSLTLSISFSIPSEDAVCRNDHTAYVTGFKQMNDRKCTSR
jgi:hypothetical protein